jgi:hypothetical protein
LNLNASYLNTIIKQNSGLTASNFIHGKMLLEAKSYLMHTIILPNIRTKGPVC